MSGDRLEVSVSFEERRGYVASAPELRARRERPCRRRAAQKRDEVAAPDAKCHLIPPAGRATEG